MSVEPFWAEINEAALRQGDYLPSCLVPVFGPDLAAAGVRFRKTLQELQEEREAVKGLLPT